MEKEFTQETQNTSEADPESVYDSAGGINARIVVSPLSHPRSELTFNRDVWKPNFECGCPCKRTTE